MKQSLLIQFQSPLHLKVFRHATIVAAGAMLLVPAIASAHPGHSGGSVADGVLHPLTGVDHLLAMVAVGIWAAVSLGRAVWLMPVTFLTSMVFGAVLGAAGVQIPFVEMGILLSVLVLGALLALAIRPTLWVSLPLIALFALFHGHAHGAEMSPSGSLVTYGVGLVFGTAALHAAGIAGIIMTRRSSASSAELTSERASRIGGVAITAAGLLLCLGLM